jgi:hypothetical protein
MMARGDRTFADGCPHAARDRLQTDAMLVRGEDLDLFAGLPCGLLGKRVCKTIKPDYVLPNTDLSSLHGLIRDQDSAFRQQIFNVAKAQRELEIEPDYVLDNFGRKAIADVADLITTAYPMSWAFSLRHLIKESFDAGMQFGLQWQMAAHHVPNSLLHEEHVGRRYGGHIRKGADGRVAKFIVA